MMGALHFWMGLLALSGPGMAAPSIGAKLDQWEVEAKAAVVEAERSAEERKIREVLKDLPDRLAENMLVPFVSESAYQGSQEELFAVLDLGFSGANVAGMRRLKTRLSKALGASTTGDTVCFSLRGKKLDEIRIPAGADLDLLTALGTTRKAIEPVPYVDAVLADSSVLLSEASVGPALFDAIRSQVRPNGSVSLSLEVDGSPVMSTGEIPVEMELSTTSGREINLPVSLKGVPTSVAKLPSQTVWRVAGVPTPIPYSSAFVLHQRLAAVFIDQGRLSLTRTKPGTRNPIHTGTASAGEYVIHSMGASEAWFDETDAFEVRGTMVVARTNGSCAIDVDFWDSPKMSVRGGPMPLGMWRKVSRFAMLRVGDKEMFKTYLEPPDCPPAAGGISNATFDEFMMRPERCQTACDAAKAKLPRSTFMRPSDCTASCMVSSGFRACLERAMKPRSAETFEGCFARRPAVSARTTSRTPAQTAPATTAKPAAAPTPVAQPKPKPVASTDKSDLALAACESGDGEQCHALGLKFVRGGGVAKNPKMGFDLIEKGCAQGYAPGCFVAAQMLRRGIGAKKSAERATEFVQKACAMGYQGAIDAGECE